jgi:hypothetical protein
MQYQATAVESFLQAARAGPLQQEAVAPDQADGSAGDDAVGAAVGLRDADLAPVEVTSAGVLEGVPEGGAAAAGKAGDERLGVVVVVETAEGS